MSFFVSVCDTALVNRDELHAFFIRNRFIRNWYEDRQNIKKLLILPRIAFFYIRKWSIRKWGYRGQKNKKVEGQNAPNLRKWPYTSFISFGNLTFRNALFTLLRNNF